jgi:hypothetical protein
MKNRASALFVCVFMLDSIVHPLTTAVIATLAGARVVVSIDPASKPANDSKVCVLAHLG